MEGAEQARSGEGGDGASREPRKAVRVPPNEAGALKERKPSPAGGAVRRPVPPGADGGGKGAEGAGKAAAGLASAGSQGLVLMDMIADQNKKETAANADMTAIVVGTAACGKSTLLKGLLSKEEEPKPTLALEYSTWSHKNRLMSHLWEVGGGTAMQKLLDVPLSENTVRNATVIIVADLSNPEEVFVGVSYWLDRLRERLHDIDKVFRAKETTAKRMDQVRLY